MVAQGLTALITSLGGDGRAFVSLRQLVAVESWLQALKPRIAKYFPNVSTALAGLLTFTTAALAKSLMTGGANTVCATDWDSALAPVREAIDVATAGFLAATVSPWSLLHGLARVDVTSETPAAFGPDLLHALWSLLRASEPFATAIGGSAVRDALVQAITEGRHGISDLPSEGSNGYADIGLVL